MQREISSRDRGKEFWMVPGDQHKYRISESKILHLWENSSGFADRILDVDSKPIKLVSLWRSANVLEWGYGRICSDWTVYNDSCNRSLGWIMPKHVLWFLTRRITSMYSPPGNCIKRLAGKEHLSKFLEELYGSWEQPKFLLFVNIIRTKEKRKQ